MVMLRNGSCSEEESPMSITCSSTTSALTPQSVPEPSPLPSDRRAYFARTKRDYFARFASEMGEETVKFHSDGGGVWISLPVDGNSSLEPKQPRVAIQ